MKFSALLAPFALFSSVALAVTTAYDPVYDNPNGSMASVACSNGANGLITRGYNTFGALSNFPNIGGAQAVTGWNSPNCGTCWELTYTNSTGVKKTINIVALDVSTNGFVLSLKAMNTLTNNNAVQFGRVDVASRKVAASVCGL
ncbi:Heat-stable antigen [Hypsizygus marmoreus]|uniref:Heat-stable antigen n=1 Tax=Hypsizygus marmoreus TaxID=39966 RepID=A0A369JZL6_HYPMA|nr:Heat-stable antigen [Hypsizygus marmoreus]